MEIYADVIFFVNFIFSYVLLYILGKFVNTVKIKKLRLAVAAVIGGISSAIIFCIEMPMWISYVLRCVAMFLMITTAYFEKRKNILNQMLWFVMLGGIMMFVMIMLVSLTGKTIGMAINNGIVYFDINSKVFAVSLGISCIMMIFFVKMFKNRKNKKYYILNVTHNDRTITVSALFDSGNLLKEPITGKYVSILEWEAAKELFDTEIEFSDIENYIEDMKLWAVPFNSLGNSSDVLFAFLADEINRTSPKTQSALLEVMEEHQVTVDGKTHRTGEPFIVIATENPVGSAGTQLLPESQLDRFMICVSMGYPTAEEEIEILKREQSIEKTRERIDPVVNAEELIQMQREVKEVFVHDRIFGYIVELAKATRENEWTELGLSPRGTVALTAMAKACAWLNGREYVVPSDVQEIFPCVTEHRIILNMKAKVGHIKKEELIRRVLESVPTPTMRQKY